MEVIPDPFFSSEENLENLHTFLASSCFSWIFQMLAANTAVEKCDMEEIKKVIFHLSNFNSV